MSSGSPECFFKNYCKRFSLIVIKADSDIWKDNKLLYDHNKKEKQRSH